MSNTPTPLYNVLVKHTILANHWRPVCKTTLNNIAFNYDAAEELKDEMTKQHPTNTYIIVPAGTNPSTHP